MIMKWEYACLVKKMYGHEQRWYWRLTFFDTDGSAKVVQAKEDSSVVLLNQLGQEGWEAFAVEPRYGSFREDFGGSVWATSDTLVERTIWLKRPIHV